MRAQVAPPSFRNSATPVNLVIIAIWSVLFVLTWINPSIAQQLYFSTQEVTTKPWALVTHSFLYMGGGMGVFWLVLLAFWMFQIGGVVEREIGKVSYLIFYLKMTLLSSLSLWLGSVIVHQPGVLGGPFVVVEAVTVVWATRHPNSPILLYGIVPLTAKWIGWIGVGLVFFSTTPQLAPFMVVPLALAWLYAANKIPFVPYAGTIMKQKKEAQTGKHWKEDDQFVFDAEQRRRDREEREKLRKLFEGSVKDDDAPDR